MPTTLQPDICVIGAGSAGLSIAAGAAQMGADTVLIEKGKMGGDCLNYGCVPSKSLLAAAKAAQAHVLAAHLGIRQSPPAVEFAAVRAHVHDVIAGIAPHDSVERFTALGVRVVKAAARFTGPREVAADDLCMRARRFVIATGSQPLVPPIPGLDTVNYLTNETIFDIEQRPEHLIVIGGGPIGCELGQAFRRLGAEVTIIEMAHVLAKDDAELVDVVRQALRRDGVELLETARVVRVAAAAGGIEVTIEDGGNERIVRGDALLLAAGRRPSIDGLDLAAAGIAHNRLGVTVDTRLRTSNKRVFAAGDVSGGAQFTHMAGYHAGIVLRNALFRLPARVDLRALPWVTFTDPELAHVGLSEASARAANERVRILRWPFAEIDRARAERRTGGLIKVIATPGGKILGASIVGPHAGEAIVPWVLAISQGLGLGAMAQAIVPYPTFGEISKRAAGSFFAPRLFGAGTKRLVRLLARLG